MTLPMTPPVRTPLTPGEALDVPPGHTQHNRADRLIRHHPSFGQDALPVSGGVAGTNLQHVFLGKYRERIPGAARRAISTPILGAHVLAIGLRGAQKEVRRIAARWVVAFVEHPRVSSWTVVKFPGKVMRRDRAPLALQRAVAHLPACATGPEPARPQPLPQNRPVLVYAGPEALLDSHGIPTLVGAVLVAPLANLRRCSANRFAAHLTRGYRSFVHGNLSSCGPRAPVAQTTRGALRSVA